MEWKRTSFGLRHALGSWTPTSALGSTFLVRFVRSTRTIGARATTCFAWISSPNRSRRRARSRSTRRPTSRRNSGTARTPFSSRSRTPRKRHGRRAGNSSSNKGTAAGVRATRRGCLLSRSSPKRESLFPGREGTAGEPSKVYRDVCVPRRLHWTVVGRVGTPSTDSFNSITATAFSSEPDDWEGGHSKPMQRLEECGLGPTGGGIARATLSGFGRVNGSSAPPSSISHIGRTSNSR